MLFHFLVLICTLPYASPIVSSEGKPKVVFKERGSVYCAHTVMHTVFSLNTNTLHPPCILLKDHLHAIRVHWNKRIALGYTYSKGLWALLDGARIRINQICEVPLLFHDLIRDPDLSTRLPQHQRHKRELENSTNSSIHHRERRQYGIFVQGIIALFSTLFGLYSTSQLTSIADSIHTGQQQTLVHTMLIHKQQTRMDLLDADVRQMKPTLKLATAAMYRNFEEDAFMGQIQVFTQQAELFYHHVLAFKQGLSQLLNNRLSLDLLAIEHLAQLWSQIQKGTSRLSSQRDLFESPLDILQLPCSFQLLPNGTLQVYVHVPVVHETFDLFHYVPFPVHMSDTDGNNSKTVLITHPTGKNMIILNKEQDLYVEMDSTDLETKCFRLGADYLCDNIPLFYRNLHGACLSGLFTSHLPTIKKLCHIEQTQSEWDAVRLSGNNYLFFSKQASFLQTICRNGTHTSRTLTGYHQFEVPADCALVGDQFRLQPTTMASNRLTVNYPINWSLEDHLTI